MQADARSKSDASATLRPSGSKTQAESEAEYLRREADIARQAISRTLEQIRATLAEIADPRGWARARPWPSIGVAAGLGFLTATIVVRSGKKSGDAQSLVERIVTDERIARRVHKLASQGEQSSTGTLSKSILATVSKALWPALNAAPTPAPADGPVAPTDGRGEHVA